MPILEFAFALIAALGLYVGFWNAATGATAVFGQVVGIGGAIALVVTLIMRHIAKRDRKARAHARRGAEA